GPLPYTFEDIVAALSAVVPNDWAAFLNERIHGHGPGAPLEGLRRGGWQVVYSEQMPTYLKNAQDADGGVNLIYSIGVVTSRDGELSEVRWGSPAYDAGLTQGTKLIAVNGMEYSGDRLKQALRAARGSSKPIELIVKNLDRYRTVTLDGSQGLL